MADELFKTHSISSLRGMLSKIQTEISQKKSLLRTCVGNKYRDVIDASDSIVQMQTLVAQFQEVLQGNIQFDMSDHQQSIVQTEDEPQRQAAILLKLLMWVPEEIYKTADFLKAARLIAVGEWAFMAIMEYEKTSEYEFPIAHSQKNLLAILKKQILQDAFCSLKDLEGLHEDTVIAILLLSDTSHLVLIQKIFDFSKKELEAQEQGKDALEWIQERTKYILSFLSKVLDLFKLTDGKAEFDRKIEAFIGELENLDAFKEHLLKWFLEKPDVERVVSLLKTEFHLKMSKIVPFTSKDLSILVSNWISFVFQDTKSKVESLLSHVNSGVELAQIRDGVLFLTARFEFERKSEELGVFWSLFSNKIISNEISFWTDLYQKCFSDRFFSLMVHSFGAIFNNFSLSLDMALSKMKDIDSSSQNFAAYFWKEKSMWSKNFSFKKLRESAEGTDLIKEFENGINEVLNDYKPMLTYPISAPGKENTVIPIESLYDLERISDKDSKEMKVAFENCSKDFTNKCMELISCEDMNDHNIHKVIFVGRLCKGLAEYASRLNWNSPVSRTKGDRNDVFDSRTEENRSLPDNKAYDIFIKAYHSIHELWIQYVISDFELSLVERFEAEQWDQEDIWTNLWIDYTIEPIEGQDGSDSLKVPVYASHNLMKKLFQVSENVQKMGAHDLDRSLLILLSFSLGKSLCKLYENLLSKSMPDKVYLQLLFDVYFMMKIFEGTWSLDSSEFPDKLKFKRNFFSLLASYKAKIDPIDLAVYENHISSFSERFLQKQMVLLSPLMIFANKPMDSRKQLSDNESHQVLSLAPATPRLSLLPIGMPPKKPSSITQSEKPLRRPSIEFYRRPSDLKSRKKPIVTITLDSTHVKSNVESVYSFVGNRQATDLLKNASSYLSGVLSTSRKT